MKKKKRKKRKDSTARVVSPKISFRSQDVVGAADAEEDLAFLHDCFVDNGIIDSLSNCGLAPRLVVGRTGSGKSALLHEIAKRSERCVVLNPESLALTHISNSDVIGYLSRLGVNMDVFYKLIWRHVLCVEFLKMRFPQPSDTLARIKDVLLRIFKEDRSKQRAVAYLEQWGDNFFETTEVRVKTTLDKVETELKTSLRLGGSQLQASDEDIDRLSKQERSEIVIRANDIINRQQASQLAGLINLVSAALDDNQKRYYAVIDRLDNSWVREELRPKLIMALLETVKDFREVRNAKIIVAVRSDLLRHVFDVARPAGFQEEKFVSMYARIAWTNQQLTRLLQRRLVHICKNQHASNTDISVDDVFEPNVVSYIIERTARRPRDVILFVNECISQMDQPAKISLQIARQAERSYSIGRLASVRDEWTASFGDVASLARVLLTAASERGRVADLANEATIARASTAYQRGPSVGEDVDKSYLAIERLIDPAGSQLIYVVAHALELLYEVGIVYYRPPGEGRYTSSEDGGDGVNVSVDPDGHYQIHPMYCRALDVHRT